MNQENTGKELNALIESKKLVLKEKYVNLLQLKANMEEHAAKKRVALNGSGGKQEIESSIKELNRKKFRVNGQEKEQIQNLVEQAQDQLEEKENVLKSIQNELNETSNDILEASKEIFGISSEIILKILELVVIEKQFLKGKLVKLDMDDVRYLERAIERMKRICRLTEEEVQKIEKIDLQFITNQQLEALKSVFKIQGEALQIVCSPEIEVIPEYQKNKN